MSWQKRVFEFPGGFLEVNDYGDDSTEQRADMRFRATCLGYLRTDVSGIGQLWDESQMRQRAAQLGYDFAGVVVYDPASGRPPLARLKAQVNRLDAEAVIVPGPEHFEGGRVPGALVEQVDVVTLHPEETYARGGRSTMRPIA
ncbi:hypothetical protein [Nocardia sp. NPDC127526]|uniref:hypothetical protein n=1 Tax=Nocardia sp. NPDC127526 TaxID=3345393 RepID=UPI003640282B